MRGIRYVEIENFKIFGGKIHVDLGHPAVLIGPNNAGKTSVIQALALWSRGVQAWYERKGRPRQKEKRERVAAGINRLSILEVPVSENRFLWNRMRVRKDNTSIRLTVNVGVEHGGLVKDCRMEFTVRDSEVLYCRPCEETLKDDALIAHASSIPFHLLYPMSGIETVETLVPEGRVNVLLGQGQTAQVLRNLCFKVVENDKEKGTSDWDRISSLIQKLFGVALGKPRLDEKRGELVVRYRQSDTDDDMDIALAGRGFQQMLLILAYLYTNKGSVLLIDEPDAHLEVLRQKQVYEMLKDVAAENKSQVVVATHSEVIVDDAIETNLTLIINGTAADLATMQDVKNSLRTFGIEHYYKARVCPRILYVEGSTDFDTLKALAAKLKHPALDVLSGRINYYYTRNVGPADTLDNRLDRLSGAFQEDIKRHFFAMKRLVPVFKGLAILDRDLRDMSDESAEGLDILYWQRYEIENYYVTPDLILRFVTGIFDQEGGLFTELNVNTMREVLDEHLLKKVFAGDRQQLDEYKQASASLQKTLLNNLKMSEFAEGVFEEFARRQKQPILLRKGEYCQMIEYVASGDLPPEVTEKLDRLAEHFKDIVAFDTPKLSETE
ncbi:MAG: AAA family ATPase [Elusimicrobia bacterium]|nr:AAA family ATPase [Elusimicrobiota bacterium]